MKKISIFILLVWLVSSIFIYPINSANAVQANPTIISPTEGGSYSRSTITVSWNPVSGATYKLYMRDLTTNMLVLNGVSNGTTSYPVSYAFFYEGHRYRVAVSATVGSTTTWSERTFSINLSSARNTIVSRGNSMNSYTWTPTKPVRGWRNQKTYNAGTTYTGIPYSQTAYQSSITSVNWVDGRYFDTALTSSTSGFYDNYTRDINGETIIIMPKYGNDCSGYVSISWNLSRMTTSGIALKPKVGKSIDTALQKYARLSPGDALVISNNHTFIIKSIEPINDSTGRVVNLKLTCNEQTPYECKTTTQYANDCINKGYIAVCKDSTLLQDYAWDWK